MLRFIVSTVIGISIGIAVMMLMHYLSSFIYPMPDGVEFGTIEFNEYMKVVPTGALILAMFSHSTGSFAASILSSLISRYSEWQNTKSFKFQYLIIGIFFTYAGWENLNSIPHPSWFKIDLLFYIPAAYFGYKLVNKKN